MAFVAMGLTTTPDAEVLLKWGGATFFALCAVMFLYVLIRPQTFVLDRDGFSVTNPIRGPQKHAWKDIDRFFIYELPKGAKGVAFSFRADAPTKTKSSMLKGSVPDGVIPGMWQLSREDLVDLLNRWLTRSREDSATSAWRESNRIAEEPIVW